MSDVKNPDQSIFQALLKLVNGEPPKPAPIKKLPPVLTPGQKIYEKTMTPEFKALEATVDVKAKEKWGVPPMHWLVTRYDNTRDRPQRSYAVFYDYVLQASKQLGLDPNYLHTIIVGEGVMNYLDEKQKSGAGALDRESNVIDSYQKAGLDNIGKYKNNLKGYLDDRYLQFIVPYASPSYNEMGEQVLPAYIHGLDTLVFAASAYIKKCYDAAKTFLEQENESSSAKNEDVLYFIAYAFFNNASVAIDDIRKLGVKVYTRKYDKSLTDAQFKVRLKDTSNIRFNTLVRMSTFERMKLLEVYA